jgi:hypothetical protein
MVFLRIFWQNLFGFQFFGFCNDFFFRRAKSSALSSTPSLEAHVPCDSVVPTPPGIRFPFLSPLRLAELRWRYSNPPAHVATAFIGILWQILCGFRFFLEFVKSSPHPQKNHQECKPKRGGPGQQRGPIIPPPDIEYPFHRPLRLAELWCRHSNPHPCLMLMLQTTEFSVEDTKILCYVGWNARYHCMDMMFVWMDGYPIYSGLEFNLY